MSVRDGKVGGKKVAYVVRREPEAENIINPGWKKKAVNQRITLFEIDGHTSSENPTMRAHE